MKTINDIKEEIEKELNIPEKNKFMEYTIGISAGGLFIAYILQFINKLLIGN